MSESETRHFGPFSNVSTEEVKPAGWHCRHCRQPVEVAHQIVPYVVPRMIFHACECGTVVTWEDENNPSRASWRHLTRLMRKTGVKVVMFNGNKPISPDFQGRN